MFAFHPLKYMMAAERLNLWLERKVSGDTPAQGSVSRQTAIKRKARKLTRTVRHTSLLSRCTRSLKSLATNSWQMKGYLLLLPVKLYTGLSRIIMQEVVDCVSITNFADYFGSNNPIPWHYYTHGDCQRNVVAWCGPSHYAYGTPVWDRSAFASYSDWARNEAELMADNHNAIKVRGRIIRALLQAF